MADSLNIPVFEYGWLRVGFKYGDQQVEFKQHHFQLLNQYATQHPDCGYYQVYMNSIRFKNYVGVIKVADLTIEVLPKTDKHDANAKVWQQVLIDMLSISLKVEAQTTTFANIHMRKMSVLETYIHLFLQETETLIHQGLVKKYRSNISNQTVLKGKLLVHHHITKNLVHAERFYVEHQVYDSDNVFNQILSEALQCIQSINVSMSTTRWCGKLLLAFPECTPLKISAQLFQRLPYDRKTQRYKAAIELARMILLNYHPDIKGGNENILAIMFDMNLLWETYVYVMLMKGKHKVEFECSVSPQGREYFWQHPDEWKFNLRPDLVVTNVQTNEVVILDTKWKYKSDTSIEDVRQMYAYGHYFNAKRRYLLYPDKLIVDEPVLRRDGQFYDVTNGEFSKIDLCGLMYIDLLNVENKLNMNIGEEILKTCFV